MTESSYFWDGTVTGHASYAPYSADDWTDVLRDLFTYDRTVSGVIPSNMPGYSGKLAVTQLPRTKTIRVDTGVALVDGTFYRNTAPIDFVFPNISQIVSPGTVRGYYRLVLRKDSTLQTVRVVNKFNGFSKPTLTQVDGTTWEIPLANYYFDGVTIAFLTDERQFLPRLREPNFAADSVAYENIAVGSTLLHIGTLGVGSAGGRVLFDQITQSYSTLIVTFVAKSNYNPGSLAMLDALCLRINNDLSPSYISQNSVWDTAGVLSQQTSNPFMSIGSITHSGEADTTRFSAGYIEIPNYTDINKYKFVYQRGASSDTYFNAITDSIGVWKKIDAITSLEFFSETDADGFLAQYSTFSLYGLPVEESVGIPPAR